MGMLSGMNADERRAWGPVVLLARKARGMTQEALAAEAEVSLPTLRGIEKGKTAPQEAVLLRVLGVLSLIDDLSQPDVTEFLARLRPILGKMDQETRARLMPAVVAMVSRALDVAEAGSNVLQFPVPSDPLPTMEQLEQSESAAHPHPQKNVEGNEFPEGP